jgi:hypothetical protein
MGDDEKLREFESLFEVVSRFLNLIFKQIVCVGMRLKE